MSNQSYGGNVDDNKTDSEYKEFLRKTIENALAVSKKIFTFFITATRDI